MGLLCTKHGLIICKGFPPLQRMRHGYWRPTRISTSVDLRQIHVPTLVVHCDSEKVILPELGRRLAAEIPDARYVSLPSSNHLLMADEPAWKIFLQELDAFLGWQNFARANAR